MAWGHHNTRNELKGHRLGRESLHLEVNVISFRGSNILLVSVPTAHTWCTNIYEGKSTHTCKIKIYKSLKQTTNNIEPLT